jgi:hypothetical protein
MAKHDNKGAAAEARIAANYLDMQASRVDRHETKTPNALANAADHLRAAADDMKSGKLSATQADEAFARANVALAEHHQKKAQDYIDRSKPLMAGYDLQAAADNFAAACAWGGQQPSQDTSKALAQARQLSDQLIARDIEREARMKQGRGDSAGASNSAASSEEQAQQASARTTGEGAPAGQQGQPKAQSQIPQNAAEVVQNLGKIIQEQGHKIQTRSATGSGSNSGQAGQSGQQNPSSPRQ